MPQRTLKILWPDSSSIDIILEDNPVADFYYDCMRRLQHLELFFGPRENPYDPLLFDRALAQQELVKRFSEFGIEIDSKQFENQSYLNYLHDVYFAECKNGDSLHYLKWTHVHDLIHLQEVHNGHRHDFPNIQFNYRNLAGPLYKPFNREYLKYSVVKTEVGMCYLTEQELGKSPWLYWQDNENGTQEHFNTRSKPWVNLIPTMHIVKESLPIRTVSDEFLKWFSQYQEGWCKHWNITGWQPVEMFAKIPIGRVTNIDSLVEKFQNNNLPIKITL